VLIYATSNRRHLMPEYMQENLETKYVGDEVHPGESVEEKISLSERFGLWVSFYSFNQDEYLAIVYYWLSYLGVPALGIGGGGTDREEVRREALQWALLRGSRSGRVAWHFARDCCANTRGGGCGGNPAVRRTLPPCPAACWQGICGLLGIPRRQG
jgi:predicted AAA+ superfamily ATPase